MFGYITPEKPELKIREFEVFKAYYCGVCKSIAGRYGQIPRFSLSYDSAFLALLLTAVSGEKSGIKAERCPVHPFKKRKVITTDKAIIDYASDMNVILAYYNLKDDVKDEGSAIYRFGIGLLKPAAVKVKKKYTEKCHIIEKKLFELAELEHQKCDSTDQAAGLFAAIMEEIACYGPLCTDESYEKILRWTGYNLGRWVYILDAYDDIEKDIKKNN